jgi:hypothetical protein
MKKLVVIGALLALAACGADGEPQAPAAKAKPGISVTGEAYMGVSGRL